jgi:glycosyltransferase involved in cell wall biosynthesis
MIHDAQIHITPASYSPAFRAWYKFQQAIVGRRQRLILTVSEFSRTQLIRYGVAPAGKVTVIPNGVDHLAGHSADPGIVTRLGLVPQGYVTALANVQAHKNIPVLFEAFRAPACSAIPLVLFGQATRAEFLAAGYDAPANVVFAGNLSDGELRALYENALCLAFPSTTEGFGLPPLEAMLVGCPVIAAPAGALPEVCGNAALFADPHDPAEWTNRIVELATDENTRQQLIAAGRARAGSFTWRRAAERLAETLLDYRARAIEP